MLAPEFAKNGSGQFCAGAAERVAEGDGAAMGIDARGVEAGLLNHSERLCSESFVELDHGDVAERETCELQRFGNGLNGTDAELFGEDGGRGKGQETPQRSTCKM